MSFSSDVKEYLLSLREKRPCCEISLLYGVFVGCGEVEGEDIVFSLSSEACARGVADLLAEKFPVFPFVRGKKTLVCGAQERDILISELGITDELNLSLCRCEKCPEMFVRGLYIGAARLTSPSRDYHLEIPSNDRYTDALDAMLSDAGLPPKRVDRRGKTSLYYKSSLLVEDFLTYIGASKYALELMEAKVIKDMRNEANRRSNCEFSNLDKAATAAALELEAIRKLQKTGAIKALPPVLYETALMRLEFEELTLEELRMKFVPPISKSGLSHRFERIIAAAKKYQ